MDNLLIEKTISTPCISFDASNNLLQITGESFPENASKFYSTSLKWLNEYVSLLKGEEVVLEFEIIYFNSSTSKIFMTILSMMDEAVNHGKNITVNWRCDERNEIAIECGEEFKEDLICLPFNIVIYKGV